MLRTTQLAAALAALSAAARAGDLCEQPHNRFICYRLHPSFLLPDTPDWPSGMPKAAKALSAVGVDPYAPGGTEVYVSQRGPDVTPPILVFNENGDLLRSWGGAGQAGAIKQNTSCPKAEKCTPDHTFGGHGLSVKPDPGQGATQIWIDDFYECAPPLRSAAAERTLGSAGMCR